MAVEPGEENDDFDFELPSLPPLGEVPSGSDTDELAGESLSFDDEEDGADEEVGLDDSEGLEGFDATEFLDEAPAVPELSGTETSEENFVDEFSAAPEYGWVDREESVADVSLWDDGEGLDSLPPVAADHESGSDASWEEPEGFDGDDDDVALPPLRPEVDDDSDNGIDIPLGNVDEDLRGPNPEEKPMSLRWLSDRRIVHIAALSGYRWWAAGDRLLRGERHHLIELGLGGVARVAARDDVVVLLRDEGELWRGDGDGRRFEPLTASLAFSGIAFGADGGLCGWGDGGLHWSADAGEHWEQKVAQPVLDVSVGGGRLCALWVDGDGLALWERKDGSWQRRAVPAGVTRLACSRQGVVVWGAGQVFEAVNDGWRLLHSAAATEPLNAACGDDGVWVGSPGKLQLYRNGIATTALQVEGTIEAMLVGGLGVLLGTSAGVFCAQRELG